MRKGIILLIILILTIIPVRAAEFTAPAVQGEANEFMPADTESFGEGLWYVIKSVTAKILPEIADASGVCFSLIAVVLLVSLIKNFSGAPKRVVELTGTLTIITLLLKPANVMFRLGVETVTKLTEYGKLLLPVMTAATAAQGGTATAASLYTATAFLNAILTSAISNLIIPMLCVYLCLSVANNAIGDEMLKRLQKSVKWLMTWSLKIVLYVFTGYMGVTGVVSGTVDANTLKAAKLAVSGVVPVVGGIIADASEAILVSAGIMKSAAGVYGIIAILALYAGPFIKIGVQYLLLKATTAVCAAFGEKSLVDTIQNFGEVMGFLLAMTGTVCLLLMISTVCFMRGVS